MTHFKQDIDELILVPSGGGRFELFVDEKQIHSKLETGNFPEPKTVIKAMETRRGS